jgi:dTDP-4-amino-4,6-dideoxygalactose transaminase
MAIMRAGLTPVLVEPNEATHNLDLAGVQAKTSAKTKAILFVHLYGKMTGIKKVKAFCEENNILLLEDAAQAQGASIDGIKSGNWGICNGFSLYPGKNLGAFGDGGVITTNDEQLNTIIRALRNYGSSEKYVNDYLGFNNRLDTIQAAMLRIKLRKLDAWNNERRTIADKYFEGLKGIGDLDLPLEDEANETSVFHQFVIRSEQRDALQQHLTKNEIGTIIHYPIPPHLQKAMKSFNHQKGDFPISEKIADTILSLPIYPDLKASQQERVIETIKSFFV